MPVASAELRQPPPSAASGVQRLPTSCASPPLYIAVAETIGLPDCAPALLGEASPEIRAAALLAHPLRWVVFSFTSELINNPNKRGPKMISTVTSARARDVSGTISP